MLLNSTIVITGASRGLGAALAKKLSSYKLNLVLFARDYIKLQQVANACNKNYSCTVAIHGDITKPADCKKLVEETIRIFGSLNHLILNAGISMWARFDEVTDISIFHKIIETNYLGSIYLTHLFLPYLKKSKGLITAISSIQGEIAVPYHSGYVASKHALTGFLNTLRMELNKSVDIMLVKPHWLKGTELRKNALNKNGVKIGVSGNSTLLEKKEHTKDSIELEQCCKKIIRGMIKRKKELVIPQKLKLLSWLKLISPALINKIIISKVKEQE